MSKTQAVEPNLFTGTLFRVEQRMVGDQDRYEVTDAEGRRAVEHLFLTPWDASAVAERLEAEAKGQGRLAL